MYSSRSNQADLPKVLLVAASLRIMGGQAVMAQRLIDDLQSDGLRVGFVPVDPHLPAVLKPFERVKYLRTFVRSMFYVAALLCEIPKHDVVHVFSASYASFLISPGPAILIAYFFRKRILLHYHSGEAEDHLRRSRALTRWLLRIPDRIVVPSDYLVAVFSQFGFAAIVVPNHVDTEFIRYRERSVLEPSILVARALEPYYGIECALRTFQIFQSRYPDARMTILGEGSERKYLEGLVDELGLDAVLFTGRVERAKIVRYYDEADIFLNTSSVDNMPLSILEAFAAGLPVVTTDAGGIPYMVEDRKNGHLVKVGDYETAAERLAELMENPAQVRRLSSAARRETTRYSWAIVGPQWKSLYENIHRRGQVPVQSPQVQCTKTG